MVYTPNLRLIYISVGLFFLSIITIVKPDFLWLWQIAVLVVFVLASIDLCLLVLLRQPFIVSRKIPDILPVGREQVIQLHISTIANNFFPKLTGEVYDHFPLSFQCKELAVAFNLVKHQHLLLQYRVTPLVRGQANFLGLDIRLNSLLALWQKKSHLELIQEVCVYPDFAKINHYILLATDHHLSQMGLVVKRRRGLGMDFHQLREYTQEDSPKQIDWKASSKQRKLISREYQDERDQQIVFLLDCSVRMRAQEENMLSHFDHTLNALILLSYVATRQGDAAGVLTFSHESPRFFSPRKSVQTVHQLMKGLYDLQPSLQVPDYVFAVKSLLQKIRKRSMIVVMSNFREEDQYNLIPALTLLRQKHLVVFANLQEGVLNQVLTEPIKIFNQAATYCATIEYRQQRAKNIKTLIRQGVHVLDVEPEKLPIALVNQYWQIKRQGSL